MFSARRPSQVRDKPRFRCDPWSSKYCVRPPQKLAVREGISTDGWHQAPADAQRTRELVLKVVAGNPTRRAA